MGVSAEASRRALARELAAARCPGGAWAAWSGRPRAMALNRATSGPRSATASMKSMTTPRAVLAASSPEPAAASPASVAPPAAAARPRAVRTRPIARRSVCASASALPGATRDGRRAAASPAPRAARTTTRTAATYGRGPVSSRTPSGTAPLSRSCPNHHVARASPGRQPRASRAWASRSASVAMERRSWRGVVPMARSRANSRERWLTESATVPAAVNTATRAAMPPKEPPSATRSSLAAGRAAPSARLRSSPVRTSAAPRRARSTWAASVPGSVPGAGRTAMASTVRGWPERARAWASVNQTPGVPVVPETVKVRLTERGVEGDALSHVCLAAAEHDPAGPRGAAGGEPGAGEGGEAPARGRERGAEAASRTG